MLKGNPMRPDDSSIDRITVVRQGYRWIAADGTNHVEGETADEAVQGLFIEEAGGESLQNPKNFKGLVELQDSIMDQCRALDRLMIEPGHSKESLELIHKKWTSVMDSVEEWLGKISEQE